MRAKAAKLKSRRRLAQRGPLTGQHYFVRRCCAREERREMQEVECGIRNGGAAGEKVEFRSPKPENRRPSGDWRGGISEGATWEWFRAASVSLPCQYRWRTRLPTTPNPSDQLDYFGRWLSTPEGWPVYSNAPHLQCSFFAFQRRGDRTGFSARPPLASELGISCPSGRRAAEKRKKRGVLVRGAINRPPLWGFKSGVPPCVISSAQQMAFQMWVRTSILALRHRCRLLQAAPCRLSP
jgi:hypothetical protein